MVYVEYTDDLCGVHWRLMWSTLAICGSTVVKVLCYKSEGRWFDPQLVSVDSSMT